MGEDRTMCAEKKQPNEAISTCRHRHSSVISSCSEDAESESTSAGYPATPDEPEREEELEYGPGIVNKLRTRFLSITLKQTRGSNMRRSCSMENLLDQDRPGPAEKVSDEVDSAPARPAWGNLKRAKSMDTLLMEMNPGQEVVKSGLVPTICDEELPKPDTVKTYKRMFEPAESRRGSHGRRPPVLRASARSSSSSKLVSSSNSSAKVNGTSRSKFSAKQPPVKAQSPDLPNGKKAVNGDPTRPLYNGCHTVKATPVKIGSARSKEVDSLNSINRLLSKKEVHFAPKTDIICNGNGNHHEILKIKSSDDVVKQFTKNSITNGNMKPKVPPNRPSLKSPKPLMRTNEQRLSDVISPTKSKPIFANGLKKPCEIINNCDQLRSPVLKSPEPKSKDVPKIPSDFQIKDLIKSPSPEVISKEDFVCPPELKSKDKAPMSPLTQISATPEIQFQPDGVIKTESTVPTPEKTIHDRIQTLAESTAKNKAHSQEKDSISKITNRTASVSPELNNSDKTFKAQLITSKIPPMKPVNGIIEPVKKPMNGFVDNMKKSITGTPLDKSNKLTPISSPVAPEKILENGVCDSVKKTTNGITDQTHGIGDFAKKTNDPVKHLSNRLTNPANKPANGSTPPEKHTSNVSDPVKKAPHDAPAKQASKSPNKPANGLPEPAKKTARKPAAEPVKKPANGYSEPAASPDIKRPIKKSQPQTTSMVFDFRGKDVVSHVAVLPTPFGCKSLHPKKRSDDASTLDDEEDEDYVDYSVPPPSGVVFEGENVKIGRGSILATRNKDLKITFDDEVDGNTFVYPSETSLLEEPDRTSTSTNEVIPNGQPQNSKLKTNTSIGSSSAGGLSTYTPSVLRTMDNFEPGMFRPHAPSPSPDPQEKRGEGVEEEEENEDLKPAGKDCISTWSISAGTSDLLF